MDKKRFLLTTGLTVLSIQSLLAQQADSLRSRSVDVVTEQRMNKGLVTNSLDALSGQAAGVNVSNGGADRMAMLSSVRVRGTTSVTGGNDPLVIIDGVYADIATLSTIYPADIESFTILKNASETALYGSRGASGVIEVRTKQGGGGTFHISYDANVGFEAAYKYLDMLDRDGYIAAARQYGMPYTDGGHNTKFIKCITRTGFLTNHHVSFNGGTPTSNYRASIALQNRQTIVKTKDNNNFIAKFDLHQQAFDHFLDINLGAFGSSAKNNYIFDVQKLFYSATAQNPTLSFGKNASGGWDRNYGAQQIAPTAPLLGEKNDERSFNFNTHMEFIFHVLQRTTTQKHHQIDLTAFGSYTYGSVENAKFCPTWVWAQGQAYRGEMKTQDWLGDLRLNYDVQWGIHHLATILLAEHQKSRKSGFWAQVKGFTTNTVGDDNMGAGSLRPYGGTGSSYEDPAQTSFLTSLDYWLLNRYKLSGTMRFDGSNLFGSHHQWGCFPSISAEWNVRNEAFMHRLPMISQLHLRMGYGASGNSGGISSYNALTLLRPAGVVPYNGIVTTVMERMRNANPELKWETKTTFNVGFDLGLLNNRIVLTAEYYHSKTKDMLYMYDVPVPPFPYNKMLANIGSMSNSGLELGLGLTPIAKRNLELNINVNLSFQRNKLLSLSGRLKGQYLTANDITAIGALDGAGFHGGNSNILYQIVGQPLGVFYLPHCTGIVSNGHGHYKYEIADLDNNGTVDLSDNGDRYVAGQATPKATLGSNISLRYKHFDVSVQLNGAFGHKIYNGTSLSYLNMSSFPDYNVLSDAPQRNIVDQNVTDYWLERGDYLNIDYLTLGWNVPVRSRYVSALRLSCSVNNLATITGYSGLTPMINSYVVNNTLGIDDKRSYPPYRTYSLSVSIQF